MVWPRLGAVPPVAPAAPADAASRARQGGAAPAGAVPPAPQPEPVYAAAAEATGHSFTLVATLVAPPGGLMPGDVLQVRVLDTGPQIALGVVDTAPGGGRPAAWGAQAYAETPAWQPDPLALHLVRWALPPSAAPLAASWRAQVLAALASSERAAAAPAFPQATPLALTGRAAPDIAGMPLPATLDTQTAAERAGYLLQSWRGVPVMLHLQESDQEADDRAPAAPPRAAAAVALRLTLVLPHLGRVALLVQPGAGGVRLVLAVEQSASFESVRAMLPSLVAALGRAGLPLLHYRLEGGRGLGATWGRPAVGRTAPGLLTPALFRAAAEVVLALVRADGDLPAG